MGQQSRAKRERREEAARRSLLAERWTALGATRGCLFCRRGDGGFISREHVFPESLGNVDLVLPNGVICDRCNNGPLAELDQVICEFMPIKMRRTMLGVTSKTGRVPTTRLQGGTVEHAGPAFIRFNTDGPNPLLERKGVRDDGTIELQLKARGGARMTPRYGSRLSRALLKTALECIWVDHGARALDDDLDHVREAVLGDAYDGYVAVARHGVPDDVNMTLQYHLLNETKDDLRVVVGAQYYGVALATDSRFAAPAIPFSPDDALVLSFQRSDWPRRVDRSGDAIG